MKPILFVEDDLNDIWLAKRAIKTGMLDISPTFVNSFRDLQSYMEGEGSYSDRDKFPLPAIIITDLKLEASSGFDVLTWLGHDQRFHHIPVFVLTSSGLSEDRARALKLGARDVMVKPPENKTLVEILTRIVTFPEHVHPSSSINVLSPRSTSARISA